MMKAVIAISLSLAAPSALAQEAEDKPQAARTVAESYCRNIASAAADARLEWQKGVIAALEAELEKRTQQLDAKMAEYQKWLARRDEFAAKAQESLVGIYAQMKPDAAASQLAAMEEEVAAAILTKLGVRKSSAIMNEMPSVKAARLSVTIAGAARTAPRQKTPLSPPESKAPESSEGRS